MPKFRPPSLAQMCASITFNELQLIALIEKALSDNSLRGFLYKRSSTNPKWRLKWFLLFENLLFYFDVNLEQASEMAAAAAASASAASDAGPSNTRSPTKGLGSFIRRKSRSSAAPPVQHSPFWQQLAIKELMSSPVAAIATATGTAADESLEAPSAGSRAGECQPAAAAGGQLDELTPGSCPGIHQLDSSTCLHQHASSDCASSSVSACTAAPEAVALPATPAPTPTTAAKTAGATCSPHKLAAAIQPPKTSATATANSSSISGVSNHFQAHNEQTIGRSTTTSAGKTGLPTGTNYASLLSRKIGVLFLEGSHCERVCDPNGLAGFRPGSATGNMQSQQPFRCSSGQLSSCTTSNGFGPSSLNEPTGRPASLVGQHNYCTTSTPDESELNCMFSLKWNKEGSKEYHFRSETEAECCIWVRTLSQARYSVLLNDKEQLEQKFLHLSQIMESESTAKWHYARQCEDSLAEIKKLRQEICHLRRQENRSNQFRLVLAKQSAALVESIAEQRRSSQLSSSTLASSHLQHHAMAAPGAGPDTCASSSSASATPFEDHELMTRGSAASMALARARSMEQEQAEHDVAVRRTRRQLLANQRRNTYLPPARVGSFDHQSAALVNRHRGSARPLVATSSMNYPCAGPGSGARASTELHLLSSRGLSTPPGSDAGSEAMREGLSAKLRAVIEALNEGFLLSDCMLELENSEEIKKIKKVQGFFRGWLCRRRWKQIVQEYIKSPHAESMRKRNNLVFRMVECEEEYVDQLSLLVSAFLRPLKMAASSQRPALDHDEVNSIFLNSETLLFLHQIFLKGLTARMESWPTLVLADLFTMLLPMLTIYQEYVRNHHFSIQVLAECKQREPFAQILKRLEDKPQLNGRTLETLLTYPMHQIPRYIICLHEILAHTPHNHVERVHLYTAQTKLEELSRQIHEEVSATESIRHNLAIERMIIGGCDILLDVSQVFVRQGVLTQVLRAVGGGRKHSAAARSRQASSGPAVAAAGCTSSGTPQPSAPGEPSTGSRWQQQLHQLEQRATACMGLADSVNSLASECGPLPVEIQIQKSGEHGAPETAATPAAARRLSLAAGKRCSAARVSDAAGSFVAGKQHEQAACASQDAGCELVRQCFLFTNHLLLCTREKDGALDLVERISLSEVTLVENPAEFLQQQHQHQHHHQPHQPTAAQDSHQMLLELEGEQPGPACDTATSSANLTCRSSIYADYSYHQGGAPGAAGKRASSASEPAKRQLGGATARAAHPALQIQAGSRASASSGQLSWRGASAGLQQLAGASPSRAARSLTGYLASKLSHLTSGGGGAGQPAGCAATAANGCTSASAPASPLNKRRKNSHQQHQQHHLQRSSLAAGPLLSLATCRDYAGRDFLLLLELNGKQQTCAFYLVAPTVQEKAAWMSDISQVSSTIWLALLDGRPAPAVRGPPRSRATANLCAARWPTVLVSARVW